MPGRHPFPAVCLAAVLSASAALVAGVPCAQARPPPVSARLVVADLVAWLVAPDAEPPPADVRAQLAWAELDLSAGRYERAAARFEQVARQKEVSAPERLDARMRAATAWRRLGRPTEAVRVLEGLLAAHGNDPAARGAVLTALDGLADDHLQLGNAKKYTAVLAQIDRYFGKKDPPKRTPQADILAHVRFRRLEPDYERGRNGKLVMDPKLAWRLEVLHKATEGFIADQWRLFYQYSTLEGGDIPLQWCVQADKSRRLPRAEPAPARHPVSDSTGRPDACRLPRLSDPWACAAMVRRGEILQRIVDMFYRLPIPEGMSDVETDEYDDAREEATQPLLKQAQREFASCIALGEASDFANTWTQAARSELARYEPGTYPKITPGPLSPLAQLAIALPDEMTQAAADPGGVLPGVEALRGTPQGGEPLVRLATALAAGGRPALAEIALVLAERGQPNSPAHLAEVRHALGRLALARGDADAARAWLERALQADPQAWAPWNDLGAVLTAQRHLQKAAQVWGQLVAARPEMATAHVGLGNARLLAGQWSGARDAFDTAIRLDPHQFEAWVGLVLLGISEPPQVDDPQSCREQVARSEVALQRARLVRGLATQHGKRLEEASKRLAAKCVRTDAGPGERSPQAPPTAEPSKRTDTGRPSGGSP